MFEKNASYLYVGNAASTAADGDAIETIAVGSVAFCTEDGKVEKQAATSGKYRIAQKLASGQLIFSPEFDMAKVKNKVGKAYVAPVQQISYLGYNGSTGAMDATAAADFILNIHLMNTMGFYNNSPLILSAAYHTTAASQSELSFGLIESLDGMLARQPYKFLKVDRINNAAVTATNDFTGDTTVVNASAAISIAESGNNNDAGVYGAGNTDLAVGDYVRIGTVAGGTALTSEVYKVTALGGSKNTSIIATLDRPVTSASGTYAAATHDIEVIPAASIGANWGLKFVGVENSAFDAIVDTWVINRFKLVSDSFSTATVTYSTKANEGSGYWKQLSNMEIYSQFLDKSPFISKYPRNNYRQEISSSNTYDVMSFEVDEQVFTHVGTGMPVNKSFKIQVASLVSLNGDDIDTVLGVTV